MPMTKQEEQRCIQLFKMGLRYNGAEYVGNNKRVSVNVHWTEIVCSTKDEWDKIISTITDWKKIGEKENYEKGSMV